jgi:hypothetical protein
LAKREELSFTRFEVTLKTTIMKIIFLAIAFIGLSAFTSPEKENIVSSEMETIEASVASFKLVNDTKEKVSIYTGSGYVSINKGGSTSITCNTSKSVHWAEKGSKKELIFKIVSDICGKTIKLSDYL